jgi:hypothetical protein
VIEIKPMPFEPRQIEDIVQSDADGLPFDGSDAFGRQAHLDRSQLLMMINNVQADAERYRFLRADNHDNVCLSVCDDIGRGVCNLKPEALDAAIDAAIAGESMHDYVQRVGLVPDLRGRITR